MRSHTSHGAAVHVHAGALCTGHTHFQGGRVCWGPRYSMSPEMNCLLAVWTSKGIESDLSGLTCWQKAG
eukprot:1161257-Pelagomonas_calceolata.AAC.5